MQRFEKIKSAITCLAWSPDGRELIATYYRGMMVGRCKFPRGDFRRWHPYVDDPVSCVAFSPDGKTLAVGSMGGLVLPYDVASSKSVADLGPGDPFGMMIPVYAMAWSPRTENVLAMASIGLRLCDVTSDDDDDIELASENFYVALAWSADESWIAAINLEGRSLEVYRLNDNSGRCDVFSRENGDENCSLSIAPDATSERMSLAASKFGKVLIYGLERTVGFTSERTIENCKDVNQVCFHPTGHFLATGGKDGSVRYWDAHSLRELRAYDWQVGEVKALAFAPDGMRCAAGGSNGSIVVWDVDL